MAAMVSDKMEDFLIEMGLPEMDFLWKGLLAKYEKRTLDTGEAGLLKKLQKTLLLLSVNPRHPGLETHEISDLTKRYEHLGGSGKVWQSYLENRKPAAGRIFWIYGPGRKMITIIGLEPHPDSDKSRAYERVRLSFPTIE